MLELSAKDFKIDIITVVKKVRTTTLGNIQVPQKEIETKPNGKLQHLKFFLKKSLNGLSHCMGMTEKMLRTKEHGRKG